MKVCLAALIPLLACLLVLPSDVNGRRRIRQKEQKTKKNEYEVSHIRKRDMEFKEHFKPYNLGRTCEVCNKLYDINKDDCKKGTKKARSDCSKKAKGDVANFASKWNNYKDSAGGGEASKAPMASPAAAGGSSSVGSSSANSSHGSSHNDTDASRDKSSSEDARVRAGWTGAPMDDPRRSGNVTEQTLNLNCTNIFPNITLCVRLHIKTIPGEHKVRRFRKRSAEFKREDYFKEQNLPKVCEICEKYYDINETDCIKNRQMATDECRKKVEENPRLFESKLTKSNSPAVGQQTDDFGTTEDVQRICSFCDEKFNFSFSDCVAVKNDIRQKCKKWMLAFDKMTRNMLNKRSEVPEANGRDSVAFSNVKEKQKLRWKGFF